MPKRVWITWETQRRSLELANKLGCELFIVDDDGPARYLKSIIRTLSILKNTKPDILFVQNPSMVLAVVACIYKFIKKIPIVVDRHTTFLLDKKYKYTPRIIVFRLLHWFTIRCADLTIVTNKYLANLVRDLRGTPFVLPDIIPGFAATESIQLKGDRNILLISSFNKDEPIREVIEAFRRPQMKDYYLYVTGNYKKLNESVRQSAPPNVIFTGFLEEQEFINMLFSVDIVMVLTTADYCMLCGCYEAVSACKPLITSDKEVLREYFEEAVFVSNTAEGISKGVMQTIEYFPAYKDKICELKKRLTCKWEEKYARLEDRLSSLILLSKKSEKKSSNE